MEEILHQLISSLSHDLQSFILYIPGGARFLPSTAWLAMICCKPQFAMWKTLSFLSTWDQLHTNQNQSFHFEPPVGIGVRITYCLQLLGVLHHGNWWDLRVLYSSTLPFVQTWLPSILSPHSLSLSPRVVSNMLWQLFVTVTFSRKKGAIRQYKYVIDHIYIYMCKYIYM